MDGLLANANVAGDTCNRGMLMGCLYGLAFGAAAWPRARVDGLACRDEVLAAATALAAHVGSAAPLADFADKPSSAPSAPRKRGHRAQEGGYGLFDDSKRAHVDASGR